MIVSSIFNFVHELHVLHIVFILFSPYTFIGNSSGTFISASEDRTGILEFIERKIAKATMIPRSHGEVCSIMELIFL